MKTLIIYKSYHKMNTAKVARVIAEVLNASHVKVENVKQEDLVKYDLIGFGSGIYCSKFHKEIYQFIEKMPSMKKKAFIFFTSGNFGQKHFINEMLISKGYEVIGEFSCSGDYTPPFGIKLNGGRDGHPNTSDLEQARSFAKKLLNF